MYLRHFGLSEPPFGITPDTAFAFAARGHQEALNTLLVALAGGEGFVQVSGEVGTGKTLLCRTLLARLPPDTHSAYIPNPTLDGRGLLRALAEELSVPLPEPADDHHLLKALNAALLEHAAAGRNVVLLLDEAQALPREALETVRLLSNLETEKRKLLQVVLFGQPELETRLAQPELRQLRQRIAFRYRLPGLDLAELGHYVAHRLRVAGFRGEALFAPAALRALHRASGGVPRLTNILAHKALLAVFGEGGAQVKRRHVQAAARDSALPAGPRLWPWTAAAAASIAAVAAVWAALDA